MELVLEQVCCSGDSVGDVSVDQEYAIITINAPSGKPGVKLGFFSSNPMSMGAVIKEVTGNCLFSSNVDAGDLAFVVNGKDTKS